MEDLDNRAGIEASSIGKIRVKTHYHTPLKILEIIAAVSFR